MKIIYHGKFQLLGKENKQFNFPNGNRRVAKNISTIQISNPKNIERWEVVREITVTLL